MAELTFPRGEGLTLGVELELQLVRAHDRDLAHESGDLIERLKTKKVPGAIKPEVTLSMIELFLDEVMARVKDVIMKMTAADVVSFARKLCAPRGPKTVCDAPPKAAPISAPLPFCRSTIAIRIDETMM